MYTEYIIHMEAILGLVVMPLIVLVPVTIKFFYEFNKDWSNQIQNMEIDASDLDSHFIFERMRRISDNRELPCSIIIDEYWSSFSPTIWTDQNRGSNPPLTFYRGTPHASFNFYHDFQLIEHNYRTIRPSSNFSNYVLQMYDVDYDLVNSFCEFFKIDVYGYSLFLSGFINFLINVHGPEMVLKRFPVDIFLSLQIMEDIITMINNGQLNDMYLLNLLEELAKNPLILDEIEVFYGNMDLLTKNQKIDLCMEIIINTFTNAKCLVQVKF